MDRIMDLKATDIERVENLTISKVSNSSKLTLLEELKTKALSSKFSWFSRKRFQCLSKLLAKTETIWGTSCMLWLLFHPVFQELRLLTLSFFLICWIRFRHLDKSFWLSQIMQLVWGLLVFCFWFCFTCMLSLLSNMWELITSRTSTLVPISTRITLLFLQEELTIWIVLLSSIALSPPQVSEWEVEEVSVMPFGNDLCLMNITGSDSTSICHSSWSLTSF